MRNRIKELRARHGLTQDDLARKVGVRRETIVFLEKGKYNPSLKLAYDIARTFDEKIEEVEERQEKIQDDVDKLRTAAITPDQVSKMIGEGMNESEARGLTARDRYIRYALFAISVGTFVILLWSRIQGHGIG